MIGYVMLGTNDLRPRGALHTTMLLSYMTATGDQTVHVTQIHSSAFGPLSARTHRCALRHQDPFRWGRGDGRQRRTWWLF